jgi:hypothetical protein
MNNNPRNNLEFSDPQYESFSENTVLEELQEKIVEDDSEKFVLIKHDYYSSDSEHGRELLRSFLINLCESSFKSIIVYLIDEGARLLDESNLLYNDFNRLIDRADMVIVDKDSPFFGYLSDPGNSKIILETPLSITEEIIYLTDLLILE